MNKRKDTVLFAVEVIATGATLYMVWRAIAGPNAGKILNLHLTKAAENFCQKQAEGWAHLADQFRKAYDHTRNVTV